MGREKVSCTGFAELSQRRIVLCEDFEADSLLRVVWCSTSKGTDRRFTFSAFSLLVKYFWRLSLKWKWKDHSKRSRDVVLRHVSELTSALKRKDPLCHGNRGALIARITLMMHPQRYAQEPDSAFVVSTAKPQWLHWRGTCGKWALVWWELGTESRMKAVPQTWGPLIYQKAWTKHLEDIFAITRLWIRQFWGEPCCRSLMESSSQDWTNSILELTFRHPGKTER